MVFSDPTGMVHKNRTKVELEDLQMQIMLQILASMEPSYFDKLREDCSNFSLENTDEEVVLDSHYFSAYKGRLVIIVPSGNSAFSFGIMFIGDKVASGDDAAEIIKHEYGHTVQLDNYGAVKYTMFVVIPSVSGFILNQMGKLPVDYYALPWEHQANVYGGAFVGRDEEARPLSDMYHSAVMRIHLC